MNEFKPISEQTPEERRKTREKYGVGVALPKCVDCYLNTPGVEE